MKKVFVILNEQHTLMEEQKNILNERFGMFEIVAVPSEGWTAKEQQQVCKTLVETEGGCTVVFASPVPVLLKLASYWSGFGTAGADMGSPLYGCGTEVLVFHNDKREKKELPNGKIIMIVAATGWELI